MAHKWKGKLYSAPLGSVESMNQYLKTRYSDPCIDPVVEHPIKLLEIEDTVMVAIECHASLLKELYAFLDIEVTEHDTNLSIKESMETIRSDKLSSSMQTLYGLLGQGKVVLNTSTSSLQHIIDDIGVLVRYMQVKAKYEKMTLQSKSPAAAEVSFQEKLQSEKTDLWMDATRGAVGKLDEIQKLSPTGYGGYPTDYNSNSKTAAAASASVVVAAKDTSITDVSMPSRTYLIYNTVYEVAIVLESPDFVKETLAYFPDFKVIGSLTATEQPILGNQLKACFHLKSVRQDKMQKLFDSFCTLHEMDKKQNVFNETEKEYVTRMINHYYDISDDVQKRMKATDVYRLVSPSSMSGQSGQPTGEDLTSCKRRVCGYLLELGLKKKRFSDGYYFYGLTPKFNMSSKTQAKATDPQSEKRDAPQQNLTHLREIEKRREQEIQDINPLSAKLPKSYINIGAC